MLSGLFSSKPTCLAFKVLFLTSLASSSAFALPRTLYDFSLKDGTGKTQSLSVYKDKPVVLMYVKWIGSVS